MQLQHVGAPGVPPLVQVGLELIQDRWPPPAGLGQQVFGAGRAGEPAHRFFGQPEFGHDRLDALALGPQRLHRLIPLAGAPDQRRVLELLVCHGVRGLLQIRFWWRLSRWVRPGFFQAATVAGHCLLHVLAEVMPQMPPVRDLHRLRCASPGAVGICSRPVPADHLGARVGAQPGGERLRFPVGQQVHRPVRAHVHQHAAVDMPTPEREIIDPEHGNPAHGGVRQGADQPQHRGPAGR